MLTIFFLQNLWWVFLITTIALVVKCFLTQKKLKDLRDEVSFRGSLLKKRLRLVQDLSDELSNGFNNIKIIAKECDPDLVEASRIDFMKIEKLCNNQINHMEDVIWAVKNKECEVEELLLKLEDYVDDVFREKGIEVEIEKNNLPLDRKLEFDLRRNFLLYFKEVINFLDENTKSKKVKITFSYLPGNFNLLIQNEFTQKLNTSLSIAPRILKMQQLAEGIGGKVIINNEPNAYVFQLIMERE